MKIQLKEITVKELVDGYADNDDEGVVGYGGKLDIRPPYQREFIYKEAQRDAVIDTLRKNFPLNVMYWAVRDDGHFEVIDGQQRTISICQYVEGAFAFEELYFQNLKDDQQNQMLTYPLMVYLCTGSDSEKLEWFKTINIAGVELSEQELRNAVYAGSWVTDAKRYFSKRGCAAYGVGHRYLSGSAIRQEYLETAIKWLAGGKANIEAYMGEHQNDASAEALWKHFRGVIDWVEQLFPKHRKEMKGLDWGGFYAQHKDKKLNAKKLETEIANLMQDDDVTNKKGVYEYVLSGAQRHLNIRAFTDSQKRTAFEKQKGKCPKCKKTFDIDAMEGDHIIPWHKGGKTDAKNCRMLCITCNRQLGG